MCGIAGLLDPTGQRNRDELASMADGMACRLTHRGPDGSGVWVDDRGGIALAHRRLAVVDLSARGAQPMLSHDQRWVTVYNGEVYNHAELRALLIKEGVGFQGHSDTEVLLEAISRWGVQGALDRADGMFALALWDRAERQLMLVRDRMGEKPLYVGRVGPALAFASELSAISRLPGFDDELSADAVADLVRYSCIPAPRTIFRNTEKLLPGQIATADMSGHISYRTWWDLRQVAEAGLAAPLLDEHESLRRLEDALRTAVRNQLLADVPVGCFLSGGVDSSLVAALAQERSVEPVKTFTVGFEDESFDEAPYARAVAEHLGTAHTEHYVTTSEVLDLVPDLATTYDEPFADSSQLPVLLVSRLARASVTVALTGDGGDELFAGYMRYLVHGRLSRFVDRVPFPVRRAIAGRLTAVPVDTWTTAGNRAQPLLPARARVAGLGVKVHKAARVLAHPSVEDLYESVMTHPPLGATPVASAPTRVLPVGADTVRRLQFLDQTAYLPDDLLVKTDRAAMSVSLETRLPLLSRPVVEASWAMPTRLLVRHGRGKWPLRQLLSRRIPAPLLNRPKQGFGIPLDAWLRGPLRGWAVDLLHDSATPIDDVVDGAAAKALLREHLAGTQDHGARLWPVLMLQAWRHAWDSRHLV